MAIQVEVAKLVRAYLKENKLKGKVSTSPNIVKVELKNVDPSNIQKLNVFCKDIPRFQHIIISNTFTEEYRQLALNVLHDNYPSDYERVDEDIKFINEFTVDANGGSVMVAINHILRGDCVHGSLWNSVWGIV